MRMRRAMILVGWATMTGCASPPPPKPVVVTTRPAMTIKAPSEMMAEVQSRYAGAINACAKGVLERDASAAGTYGIRFRVDPTGTVFPIGVDGPNDGLRACLLRAANKWTFSAQLDGNGKPVVSFFTLPLKLHLGTKPTSRAAKGTMEAINSRYMAKVHACHNAAARRDASVHGLLTIVFQLRQDGSVGEVNISGAGGHAALLACVRDSVRQWQLPPPVLIPGATSYPVRLRIQLARPKVRSTPTVVPDKH